MTRRIGLIHATAVSMRPVEEAFVDTWPEARRTNLLDDSLSQDLVAAGAITPQMDERFLRLAAYVHESGAEAILFTCSAFGPCIDKVKAALPIPVLKPNEAMVEDAVARGTRIGLVATMEASLVSMRPEFEAAAAARGRTIELVPRHVPGAMDALAGGDGETHDALVARAAEDLSGCDVIALAQFSMARARDRIAGAHGRTVLTTPDAAVKALRTLMRDQAA